MCNLNVTWIWMRNCISGYNRDWKKDICTRVSKRFKKGFCEKWLCFNRLRENIEKYEREASEEKAPNGLLYLPAAWNWPINSCYMIYCTLQTDRPEKYSVRILGQRSITTVATDFQNIIESRQYNIEYPILPR